MIRRIFYYYFMIIIINMYSNEDQAKDFSSCRLKKHFHHVEKVLKQEKTKEMYCFHYTRYFRV